MRKLAAHVGEMVRNCCANATKLAGISRACGRCLIEEAQEELRAKNSRIVSARPPSNYLSE